MNRLKSALFATTLLLASCASAGMFEDFFRAVEMDLADNVTSLLKRGFDPNTINEQGQSGLFLAMREGSEKAAAALLVAPGTEVDRANHAGETALMMAALKGRAAWCVRLIEKGAAVNRSGWSPLHYAASGPEAEVVKVLLDRSAAINARSPNGTTPLMMAAQYGTDASVHLLLQRGADITLRNEKELTAADFAKIGGREKLAAVLMPK